MRSKEEIRRHVWTAMERDHVARFPGALGRIPNFVGAKAAAARLAEHPAWRRARIVKVSPDAPLTHARRLALAHGKLLVVAVPRLRQEHPFRLLDPSRLDPDALAPAATIKGALRYGEVIDLEQVPRLDLVLTGSVAVNLLGARVGKGGGYSDLEYGLLTELGKVDRDTMIASMVHPVQILDEDLLMTDHDIPLDLVATPKSVIEVERAYARPRGVLWDHLQPPQIHEVPVLERMGYAA